MNRLGVQLRRHGARRESFCVVCGGWYQEESVAAALVRDGWSIGEVCPRCLGEGAVQGARRLRLRARRLTARAQQLRQRGGNAVLADVALDEAGWLDDLAERLPEVWDLTAADLMRAEKAALRERFPDLPDGVLWQLVDGRLCYKGLGGTPVPVSQGL
jgi:hypothetical protein